MEIQAAEPRTIGPAGWLRSVPAAIADLLAGRTHCHPDHVGRPLRMSDGTTYVPFRNTRKEEAAWSTDHPPVILQPRFHLEVLRPGRRRLHSLFRVMCIITTPFFVGLPGFRSKLWMVDPVTGDFAGLYEWDDLATAQAYAGGLARVLRLLSTSGSVSYELTEGVDLDGYLLQAA